MSSSHPDIQSRCECEEPGTFCSGVPGILAHVEQGHLVPGTQVERCDLCQRFSTDDAAYEHLVQAQIAPVERLTFYTVHCYAICRVPLTGIAARTAVEAAQQAADQFDWDRHQSTAEFADDFDWFLVDIEGDPDFARTQQFDADFNPLPQPDVPTVRPPNGESVNLH